MLNVVVRLHWSLLEISIVFLHDFGIILMMKQSDFSNLIC